MLFAGWLLGAGLAVTLSAAAGGLTVAGGTETLTGNNGYTGTTTINHGAELVLTGAGSIGGSSGVVDNGTFNISGTTSGATITTLSGTGVVTTGTESLTILDGASSFTGNITGNGALNVGGGQQTWNGTSTFSSVDVTGGAVLNVGATYSWTGGPGTAHSAAAKGRRHQFDTVAGSRMASPRHSRQLPCPRPIPARGPASGVAGPSGS